MMRVFVFLFMFSHGQDIIPIDRMNLLFLAVDDLNTWLLGDTNRYAEKVIAPNIRRFP